MVKARGEYIFLIDRSGSMSGQRIEAAKEALIIFLKSLPEDSYFDVVSFGSNHEYLSTKISTTNSIINSVKKVANRIKSAILNKSNESMKYSDSAVSNAINTIKKFNADFGGTEILAPLQDILAT